MSSLLHFGSLQVHTSPLLVGISLIVSVLDYGANQSEGYYTANIVPELYRESGHIYFILEASDEVWKVASIPANSFGDQN